MPEYSYAAKNQQGRSLNGRAFAQDEQELARNLRAENLFLVSFKIAKSTESQTSPLSFFESIFGRISVSEKLFFIRNLEVMISAGVSLPRALQTLALSAKNPRFKKILSEINQQLIQGKSFSACLADYPDAFSPLFQNLLKVGEESGTLNQSLKNYAGQLAKEEALKSRLLGALIYPEVVILAMLAIGILMLVVFVPQLAETFRELQIPLPLTTEFVIWLGASLQNQWPWFLVGLSTVFFLASRLLKTKLGREFFDRLVLKTPVLGLLVREMASVQFTRNLSSLISSGVPLVRSLEIIEGTLGNVFFKEAARQAREKVKKGIKLSSALKPYESLYLPIMVQLLEVGEETGETSRVLTELAEFLEEEVVNATKNLASLIEPLLMLLVGAAVGFFAISMIQPMYSMLEQLK